MNEYTISKGKIISEQGLPHAPRWFADNRVAFQVDEQGIADIDYFNVTSHGNYKAFHKNFWGGMRFYINDGNHNYLVTPKKCEIMPFGHESVCEIGENQVGFSLFVANDTVFIVLKTGENVTDGTDLNIEFYDEYCLKPGNGETADIRYKSHIQRKWKEFVLEDNCLVGGFSEDESKAGISFTSNGSLKYRRTPRNVKNILSVTELQSNSEYVICLSFDTSSDKAKNKCIAALAENKAIIAGQYQRYEEISRKAPVLKSPYPLLNEFFALCPLYHESIKVVDVPGAIRAQTTHYWVWGWDSMTSNESTMYWGDEAFVGDMVACMEKYAEPEAGISHAFSRNMKCAGEAAPPAQGMYLTLLYLYQSFGGNIEKHYDFAKTIFNKILSSEKGDLGLCKGTSLYPDFRNLINESGNDISSFNNTVSFCAVRSMEKLANVMGDTETEKIASEFGNRIRKNFIPVLFDEQVGFVDSSVEADTFEKRHVPSNNAVKWENNFCDELLGEVGAQCLEFYEKNILSPAGLRPIPVWSEPYDLDANQLSCWWPVMTEFYSRLINRYNKPELTNQWIGWVEYWTEKLMCPEGISCYADTDKPPLDNWNCMGGIWHGYSIRGWYTAAVHSVVGVDLDAGGLTVYPSCGKELELLGLHFGEKTFDIQMRGSGQFVESIVINGTTIVGTNKVPFDLLKNHNTVVVNRGIKAVTFCHINRAYGVKITDYSISDNMLSATLHGTTKSDFIIGSDSPVTVEVNGKSTLYQPNGENTITIQIAFPKNESVCLNILK